MLQFCKKLVASDRVQSRTYLDRVERCTINIFLNRNLIFKTSPSKRATFQQYICTNFWQNSTTFRVSPILLKIAYNFFAQNSYFQVIWKSRKLLCCGRNNYWIYVWFWAFCSNDALYLLFLLHFIVSVNFRPTNWFSLLRDSTQNLFLSLGGAAWVYFAHHG